MQIDLAWLDSVSKFFGGYHPVKFALMLVCLGAAIWLLIFGKVGNPSLLRITWSQIKDINNVNDESLFQISQYRYLAQWFDESLKIYDGDNKRAFHTLWLGRSEELRENTKKLTISFRANEAKYNLAALIIQRVDQKILIHNLQQTTGLPLNQEPRPNLTFELESLKKGERVEILMGIVAVDEASFNEVNKKTAEQLVTCEVKPT